MTQHIRRTPRRALVPGATLAISLVTLMTTGCGMASTAASSDAGRMEIQKAVDSVYPALVRIDVVMEQGGEGRMEKLRGTGSGTIISPDGYIVTNHHVAGRGTRISVRMPNREDLDAELIGTDPLSDISIIKIDPASRRDPSAPLPFAKFGDSDTVRVGDVVLAMGSPAGLSQSVTKGIVANTAMIASGGGGLTLDGESVGELVRWIGHDAVIFPGNSGGPLVNLQGEIIGVNEVGIGSLGGAIPSNIVKSVQAELIAKHYVSRSWIGLEVQPLLKSMTKDHGVLVATVLPDSPAEKAGIKSGDFLTQYNGVAILDSRAPEDIPLFNRLVFATPVNSIVVIQGVRAGKPMTWKFTSITREPKLAKEVENATLGVTVRDFTRVSALENQRPNKNGVMIDSVRPGGPCTESKPPLRHGDIILQVDGKPVSDAKALDLICHTAAKDLKTPAPVLVEFERDSAIYLTVPMIGPEAEDEKTARAAKAWLGVATQVLTHDIADALKLDINKGVRITLVVPDSPAEKAGIKIGDIFHKLDGQVIAASLPGDQELFENLVHAYKIGSEMELEGLRDGKPIKLTVKLGRQPKSSSEFNEYKDDRFEFTVREMSLNERVDEKMADDVKGVRISSVHNNGWAALAGLGSGDILLSIDGKPTPNIETVKAALLQFRVTKPRRVVFFIRRGIYTFYAEIEPKWSNIIP